MADSTVLIKCEESINCVINLVEEVQNDYKRALLEVSKLKKIIDRKNDKIAKLKAKIKETKKARKRLNKDVKFVAKKSEKICKTAKTTASYCINKLKNLQAQSEVNEDLKKCQKCKGIFTLAEFLEHSQQNFCCKHCKKGYSSRKPYLKHLEECERSLEIFDDDDEEEEDAA